MSPHPLPSSQVPFSDSLDLTFVEGEALKNGSGALEPSRASKRLWGGGTRWSFPLGGDSK